MRRPPPTSALPILCLLASAALLLGCGGGSGDDGGGTGPGPGPGAEAYLFEDFLDTTNRDDVASSADWGLGTPGYLVNAPASSRTAYAYSYVETNNGTASGRGQYAAFTDPLTGTDQTVAPPYPAIALGRRVQWSFGDEVLGADGTITAVSWGPAENATVAASYPNVKLRMGYQAAATTSLGGTLSGNYEDPPTVVYDGAYSVAAVADVGNTPGQPTTPHVGGYLEGIGCFGAPGAPGGHNAALFAYTGWYPWPALSTPFDWNEGDPLVENDRRLIFDASVQAGDFTQRLRGWYATTYPCSGILIPGYPDQRVYTTYESDVANPPESFPAGILNPEPSTVDMCFTITSQVSVGQSLFLEGAYGDDTNYDAPTVVPATQTGNAVATLLFQGADAVETDRRTIDFSAPATGWVPTIDACDGMRYIRWRILLTPDPVSMDPAQVDSIRIRMTDLNP